jgi:hypothetical protein
VVLLTDPYRLTFAHHHGRLASAALAKTTAARTATHTANLILTAPPHVALVPAGLLAHLGNLSLAATLGQELVSTAGPDGRQESVLCSDAAKVDEPVDLHDSLKPEPRSSRRDEAAAAGRVRTVRTASALEPVDDHDQCGNPADDHPFGAHHRALRAGDGVDIGGGVGPCGRGIGSQTPRRVGGAVSGQVGPLR